MYIREGISQAATLAATLLILVFSSTVRAEVVRTPISGGQFAEIMGLCLLQGGTAPPFTDHVPAICCATNEEGTRWCVACYSGTADNPRDCSVTTPGRQSAFDILRPPAPGSDVLAPTPGTTAPANDQLLQFATPMYQMFTVD